MTADLRMLWLRLRCKEGQTLAYVRCGSGPWALLRTKAQINAWLQANGDCGWMNLRMVSRAKS